jgi:pSer/pThr/pTyr-binding forkhead associated (FHA) protein
MKVRIEIDKGSTRGARFELSRRSYRAVGRSGGQDITVQLTTDGDRFLEPDDLERIEGHLSKRGPSLEGAAPAPRVGNFRREKDILLDDEKVSRTHAMIFLDEDGPSIVDLNSTNGTHVNGRRMDDADLRDGDIVNIGKTRFIVSIDQAQT